MRLFGPVLVCSVALSLNAAAESKPELTPWRRADATGALQARLDRLLPGERLVLEAGRHEGPIIIKVPGVTIEGDHGAVIDGRGLGTVVSIQANGVTLRGLTITGSGNSNPLVHAGVTIDTQSDVRLERLTLRDTLFGIEIANSHHVRVEKCDIASKAIDETFRGDALRIWHSKDVDIVDNHWHDARDAVAWYSDNVRFLDNRAERSRYSIHGMYSKNILIKGNRFEKNAVGIFLMYGTGSTVVDNEIRESNGATGIGLGLKETSLVYARDNRFVYCASGILVDNSPWEPGTRNWFHGNLLAFNDVGVLLANDRPGSEFKDNQFQSNRMDVDTEARRTSPGRWLRNYWDSYAGFDRDGDGWGDTPHAPRKFGDLMTGSHPSSQFFRGSPVLQLISLLERLVPMTEPLLLLEDAEPRFVPPTLTKGSSND